MFPSLLILLSAGIALASSLEFGIPASQATVTVQAFHVGQVTLVNLTHAFILPALPGRETVQFPMFAFLVEHQGSQSRMMFDLGMRKDPLNLAPSISSGFAAGMFQLQETNDITEQLEDGGIKLETIETVIWSHSHFDHIGDMSKFPNSTNLVIGPGTVTSTFPQNPNASLQASDFAGRHITELDFTSSKLTFSGLQAIDFFEDGSFYLLNTPGHVSGHISALARVTPTTFVSLGGDTFHHAGEARPRPAFQQSFPCPAHLAEEIKSSFDTDFFWSPKSTDGAFDIHSRASQMFEVSDLPDSFYEFPVTAQVSLEKLATFDADPDIFVVVAHDASLQSTLPLFPASLNNWKEANLKESTVWTFANTSNPAFAFSPM
ncbi:beta-lactamase-like protein [Roridomyces roridus]|uniref:Beta-lactamase-like protein n=1 Tax=Roridomyces roridus TaxID=1738132 RepID=A0AAD7CEW4_9AGAR|nr:beta-lactamase-like protein [Roridomyces roridus]